MKPPQLDEYVPTSALRVIGALKRQAARGRFYVSMAQFLMIAVLFYNQSTLLQSVFPTIGAWVAVLVVASAAIMVLDYVAVLPSEIVYGSGQNARENRNPLYAQTVENGRDLEELKDRIDQLEGGGAGMSQVGGYSIPTPEDVEDRVEGGRSD